ncbi:MAG: glycosyltransferase family 4 protein [Oscillospiraceae bacterium]|nr:glycosyltransferase family 4 protein [Oscillospiraceae bacterium]
MKKLLITSTELMMIQFLVPHVKYLSEQGYHVEIACSEVGGRMDDVRNTLEGVVKKIHILRLERSPLSPRNFHGYQDLKKLLSENRYDIIWTNEPVMGVVTRLAANKYRRKGTKVLYMCHGFHFYKGASLPNWLIFYPIERFMSRFCDMIVTINHEDEARARTFHCPHVEYIHGIGVNTDRLHNRNEQSDIRSELGLKKEDFLVLSVGELNENKNQQVILRAIAQLNDPDIHYLLCGKGDKREFLEALAKELGIAQNVHFLGYRKDVVDICHQSDVFAHASRREGISVASLEAMYCGLPLVMSKVRGAEDYLIDGESGFLRNADDVAGFADGIRLLKDNEEQRKRSRQRNRKAVIPYCVENVKREILQLIQIV